PAVTRGGAPLPSGVTFVDNGNGTGTLSGTPGAGTAGTYALTFTPSNSVGTGPAQAFTLTVNAAPTPTSTPTNTPTATATTGGTAPSATATSTATATGTATSTATSTATATATSTATPTGTPIPPDLTVSKGNSVGGTTNLATGWTWTLTVANGGTAPALFASGQTVLVDTLPSTGLSY